MEKLVFVALGGGIGALIRYFASLWFADRFGTSFPYGTLCVNVTGCLLIGFLMTMITEKMAISEQWRFLAVIGFAGGLTTFSTYSYETWLLLQNAKIMPALLNAVANVVFGFAATAFGIFAARMAWF